MIIKVTIEHVPAAAFLKSGPLFKPVKILCKIFKKQDIVNHRIVNKHYIIYIEI